MRAALLLLALSLPACAEVLGPAWLEPAAALYHSFDAGLESPEVLAEGLTLDLGARVGPTDPAVAPVSALAEGFVRGGAAAPSWQAPLTLRGPMLSPHRPLTISFWWALPEDLPEEGGFQLWALQGGGLVSHFVRGRGEWCALQRPAGVFQVYYFPGIQNVNGLYDMDLRAHLDTRKGAWHHEAVVFRRAQQVEVYTDGALVCETTLSGREFAESDNLTTLSVGGGIVVDELSLLTRAIEPAQIAEYNLGLQRIREMVEG